MKFIRIVFIALLVSVVAFACKKKEAYEETATTDTTATSTSATDTTYTTATNATTATTASTGAPLNDFDKDFLQSAARGGKAEVEMAQDALTHAKNADVKALAQKILDDHTKANSEAATFASSRSVELPDVTDAKVKETKERLAKLTGSNFDQAYVNQMVSDHEEDVKKFQEASTKAADADLKAWIDKTIPTLQEHLKMAKDLQAKIGKR